MTAISALIMAVHDTRDVTVTMAVEMEDAAAADCPAGHQLVFAWVPAHSHGTDDFGVYFEDASIGATLQNGLIVEIIEKARIEALVAAGS